MSLFRNLDLDSVREAVLGKHYAYFTRGNYNLNIIGIRGSNPYSNTFDDAITLSFKERGQWTFLRFPATTDPGRYYLRNPMRNIGTAIMVPGQHRSVYGLGKHKGVYEALVQKAPIPLYRDNDRNRWLNFDADTILVEMAGINIHSTTLSGDPPIRVDLYSAGCQVIQDRKVHFPLFMEFCKKSVEIYGSRLSYTLLEEKDLNGF